MLEADIQKVVCSYLTVKRVFWWRMHLGGVRRSGKGYTSNPLAGFPDVAGIVPKSGGSMFCMEFKTETGVVSEKQKEWYEKLTGNGVKVYVVRCREQGIQTVDGWF